jgi:putative membrane protein
MGLHMTIVAVAAPILSIGIAGSRFDPFRAGRDTTAPILASIVELTVVWLWHVPVLHTSAREQTSVLLLEQSSFLAAGLLLWLSAIGGGCRSQQGRAGAGVIALLLTSMHMTLLGALLALAPRAIYGHAPSLEAAALADQHLGGAIMLVVGGASYLAGGLWLSARLLLTPPAEQRVTP